MSKIVIAKKIWNLIRFYSSFIILALYLIVSILFLFTDTWTDFIPTYRITIGISMLLFAMVRFYAAFSRFKRKKQTLHSILLKSRQSSNEIQN